MGHTSKNGYTSKFGLHLKIGHTWKTPLHLKIIRTSKNGSHWKKITVTKVDHTFKKWVNFKILVTRPKLGHNEKNGPQLSKWVTLEKNW